MSFEVPLCHASHSQVAAHRVRAERAGVLAVVSRDVRIWTNPGVICGPDDEVQVLADRECGIPRTGCLHDGAREHHRLYSYREAAEERLHRNVALQVRGHRPDRSQLGVTKHRAAIGDQVVGVEQSGKPSAAVGVVGVIGVDEAQ